MKPYRTGIFAIFSMAVLILDSKTALKGIGEGVQLCLYTVVPALFPFFVFSSIINETLIGRRIPFLRPLGKLCGMPAGSESLLMLGFFGGYPVGAQAVSDAYRQGALSKPTAQRLLGFCSNAGPSFLFGLIATLFADWWAPWVLWGIQILSTLLVGILLPGKDTGFVALQDNCQISVSIALKRAIRVMAEVCGWIILFRMYIAVCSRWVLWVFPPITKTIFSGILELSNGCIALSNLQSQSIRFILASGFLSFGGLCVYMQTVAVCGNLGLGMYIPGKILQTVFSLFLSGILLPFLYPGCSYSCRYVLIILPAMVLTFAFMKKVVAKQEKLLYNRRKKPWEDTKYVVP